MRERKYRGQRIDNKEWVYGSLIWTPNAKNGFKSIIVTDGANLWWSLPFKELHINGERWYQVIPETVGEFTGLYDESDCLLDENAEEKPVFTGDIVLVSYKDKSIIAKVEFDMGMYVLLSKEFPDDYISIFEVSNIDRDYEWINGVVIGNIYDNPGLLEGGVSNE